MKIQKERTQEIIKINGKDKKQIVKISKKT